MTNNAPQALWYSPQAAPGAAKSILAAMEAPPVTEEVLARLQRLAERHGSEHVTLLIRTIIESEGNEQALVEPVVSAVSLLMVWQPAWTNRGLAWIEAFDSLALLQIVDTMRGLSLFKESSLPEYLARILNNKLLRIFDPAEATPIKRPYRRRVAGESSAKRVRIGKKAARAAKAAAA